jgi:transposase
MTQRRHELSDAQWQRIHDQFPTNGKRGGQWKDHRLLLNGILWTQATGAAWRDLPERFGPWQTVYGRFRRWTRTGFWQQLLEHLQVQRQANGQIDWNLFFIDGTIVRAHKAAAGARKKKGPPASRLTTPWAAAKAVSAPRSIWSVTARACRWPWKSVRVRSTRRST